MKTFKNPFYLNKLSDERIFINVSRDLFILHGVKKMDIYNIVDKARKTGKIEKVSGSKIDIKFDKGEAVLDKSQIIAI